MDIFPNICNNIVTNGGVKCLAQVLERSMGFIDLNEACIKGIEKISTENRCIAIRALPSPPPSTQQWIGM